MDRTRGLGPSAIVPASSETLSCESVTIHAQALLSRYSHFEHVGSDIFQRTRFACLSGHNPAIGGPMLLVSELSEAKSLSASE